ncbi:hypothetical protein BH10ACI1_BH10ACI1_13480 [soil metagenome]
MKKCPICEKTFEDSMRFCQTDGTPLLDFVESPPDDPLKTTVVRQEDIASSIPSNDPFDTSVASSPTTEDSGDLLQLPEEFDPLKTVVSREHQKFELNVSEPKQASPASPFDTPSMPASPFDTPMPSYEPKVESEPAPPKFNEPSLSPPNFGNMSTPQSFNEPDSSDEPPPTAIYMPGSSPFSSESSKPQTPYDNSPFDKPMEKPFDAPIPSPFDTPKTPIPSYKEPEPFVPNQQNNPFDTPSPFGGGQMQQQSPGFNQPAQQSDWNPPPAPGAGWQDQGLGANTPFQPPISGVGQDQTMAVVSLICGIAGLVLCALAGPVGLITGFMARKKAMENPSQYGGAGMAMAGMITGGIATLLLLLVLLYVIAVFGFAFSNIR